MATKSTVSLELPMLALIVGTRAALGMGIGLLLADKLGDKRRAVGATLLFVGAITTVPAAFAVFQGRTAGELG